MRFYEFHLKFDFLQMGAYHTLDVEQNRKFTLVKPKWDSVALERVDTACDPTQVSYIYQY